MSLGTPRPDHQSVQPRLMPRKCGPRLVSGVIVVAALAVACGGRTSETSVSGGSAATGGAGGGGGQAAIGGAAASGGAGRSGVGGTAGSAGDGGSAGSSAAGSSGPCSDCAQGCCQDGTCIRFTAQTTQACGFGGIACETCKPGGQCIKGACMYPQPGCGPANCAGCCVDANMCTDGTSGDACGHGGQACQACGDCIPRSGGGGSCHLACGPSNCEGCCQGDSCLLGESADACGTQGQACATCAPGETCSALGGSIGGICKAPCSPATCNGCCHGDVCAVGNQDIACGRGGATCADCTSTKSVCSPLGSCREP